ncbi:MAG: sialidase family protein [Acidobacteriota bacterium]
MTRTTGKFLGLAAAILALSFGAATAQMKPQVEKRIVVAKGAGYFPVLLRLKTGRLLVVFRSNAPHINVHGELSVAWSDDNGSTWSKPVVAAAGENDHRNPAMIELPNGDILLAFCIMDGYDASGKKFRPTINGLDPRTALPLYVVRSHDHGATWSKQEVMQGTQALAASTGEMLNVFGKMTTAGDGSILVSTYTTPRDHHTTFERIMRSTDSGKTWSVLSTLAKDVNETGILALPHNRVIAALRTNKEQMLLISHSADNGKTWDTPTAITNAMEHPADLIPLKNGDILLTFGERNAPRGAVAMLSHDGGKTWDPKTRMVLADDAPLVDCGYPSSVQLPDGRIVTVYYKVDDAATAPASTSLNAIIWQLPKEAVH